MAVLMEFRCPRCGLSAELFVRPGAQIDCLDCYEADDGPVLMDRLFSVPAIRGETVSRP